MAVWEYSKKFKENIYFVGENRKRYPNSYYKELILQGNIITTDCWKVYNELDQEKTFSCKNSINFVDPQIGTHTQIIERIWQKVKAKIPKYGQKEFGFDHRKRLHENSFAIANLYNLQITDNKKT